MQSKHGKICRLVIIQTFKQQIYEKRHHQGKKATIKTTVILWRNKGKRFTMFFIMAGNKLFQEYLLFMYNETYPKKTVHNIKSHP